MKVIASNIFKKELVNSMNELDKELRDTILEMNWYLDKLGSIHEEALFCLENAKHYNITLPIEKQLIYAHIKQYKELYNSKDASELQLDSRVVKTKQLNSLEFMNFLAS